MRDNNKVEVMTEKKTTRKAKEKGGIIEKRLKNITKEEMFTRRFRR